MKPPFTPRIVADDEPAPEPPAETVAQRVRRTQAEALTAAADHVRALSEALAEVVMLATEIAEGGGSYKPGVPDLARRLAEECAGKAQTLQAISARADR